IVRFCAKSTSASSSLCSVCVRYSFRSPNSCIRWVRVGLSSYSAIRLRATAHAAMADWNWGSSVDTVDMTVGPITHCCTATLMRPHGNYLAAVNSTLVDIEGDHPVSDGAGQPACAPPWLCLGADVLGKHRM